MLSIVDQFALYREGSEEFGRSRPLCASPQNICDHERDSSTRLDEGLTVYKFDLIVDHASLSQLSQDSYLPIKTSAVALMSTQSILLKPRPFARYSQPSGRFLLLPLLPERKPLHDLLPTEIWIEVFKFAASRSGGSTLLRSLLTVSKRFKVSHCQFRQPAKRYCHSYDPIATCVLTNYYRKLHFLSYTLMWKFLVFPRSKSFIHGCIPPTKSGIPFAESHTPHLADGYRT